jgi:DNA-binding transcriptional regulator YiaG
MKRDQINRSEVRTLPEFLDEDMGIPVILIDAAYVAQSGDSSGVVVPDVAGLEASMAIARVMDDFKLGGKEFKFLRKAIGIKAVDLADFLGVTPETLSRWENGKEPISTNAERVMRMRTYHSLRDKAPGVKADLDTLLNMKFKPVRLAGDGTMTFKRMPVVKDGDLQIAWFHDGFRIRTANESSSRLRALDKK